MRRPSRFQFSETAKIERAIAIDTRPDAGPSSLLLLEAQNSLMGRKAVHVAEEKGFTSMTNPESQQIHLNAVDTDAPHSRIQLHILPRAHKPRLLDALPVARGKVLLSGMLDEVLT